MTISGVWAVGLIADDAACFGFGFKIQTNKQKNNRIAKITVLQNLRFLRRFESD
jgi:hypothetical protein